MSDSDLLLRAVTARVTEYEELSQIWRDLDSKAQNSIPLIGILLAAFIGFVTRSDAHLSGLDSVLAIVEVLLLFASAGFFLRCLSVREFDGPPHFGDIQDAVEDLLKIPAYQRVHRQNDFLRQELAWWAQSNNGVRSVADDKVRKIFWGQLIVGVAVFWLSLFAVIQILELRNGTVHKMSERGGADGPSVLLNLQWRDASCKAVDEKSCKEGNKKSDKKSR